MENDLVLNYVDIKEIILQRYLYFFVFHICYIS